MKKTNAHRGLHLVSAEEAVALAQQPQEAGGPPENSRFVTIMVWYYRELKDELAGLGDEPTRKGLSLSGPRRRRCAES